MGSRRDQCDYSSRHVGHRIKTSATERALQSVRSMRQSQIQPDDVCAVMPAAGTWMVVLAALISSTLLNCIFPFFTYVESSGMLGEFLPQVK